MSYSAPHAVHPFSSHKPEHSEPKERRPCRVLFVRNIHFDVKPAELKQLFADFGDLKNFYSLSENRGLAFITFYDLRAAEQALKNLHMHEIFGRPIYVDYSIPKENEDEVTCDSTKDQGTLLLTVKRPTSDVTNEQIFKLFSQFGAVKAVRDFRKNANQKFIEFFDSRDCVRAHDALLKEQINGSSVNIKYVWDYPSTSKKEDRAEPHRTEHRQEPHRPEVHRSQSREQESANVAKRSHEDEEDHEEKLKRAQWAQDLLLSTSNKPSIGSQMEQLLLRLQQK